MEFYVLYHDFNKDTIEPFNIFRSVKFSEGVDKLLKEFITFDDFVEKLEKEAMYAFWSKVEYEIIASGVVSKNDNEYKIDIYDQIKPNIKLLANYIINYHNEHLN